MCNNPDLAELNKKYYRQFYDSENHEIVWKYTILIDDNNRYIQIPDNLMQLYHDECNKRYVELTDMIRYQYPKKYIHLSAVPVAIENLVDTSAETGSWLGFRDDKTLYHNPYRLWFSCGSAWLDYLQDCDNQWVKAPYVYDIKVDDNRVLKINNMFQFRKFTKKYKNPDPEGLIDIINWLDVKADYDGLIICPYLGHKIWKRKNPENFGIGSEVTDYIESALDEKVFDIDDFIYEWYRHWETATGVIWRPSAIKSIDLINENHWHEDFMKKIRLTLVPDIKNMQQRVSSKTTKSAKATKSTKASKVAATSTEAGITILTYNVSWQSTSGRQEKWPLCNNYSDESNSGYYGKCINNMIELIDGNGPYDFVCLQETTNLDTIISKSNFLSKMSNEKHQSGQEEMVTFWNNKYHLIKIINGEFKAGRPYQILIFKEKICLVNLHMPHTNKFMIGRNLSKIAEKISHLDNYRYIMAGDFNYSINDPDPKISLLPKILLPQKEFFISPTYIKTCCVPPYEEHRTQFDHVIDSYAIPRAITSPTVVTPASDHLPIIAELEQDIDTMNRIYKLKYGKYKKKYLELAK